MKFFEFSRYLERLEATPSRLEITKILSELLNELKPEEIEAGVFLSLGDLGPRYDNPDTGISEKMMIRVIARAFTRPDSEVLKLFKAKGDLGQVAQEIKDQKSPPKADPPLEEKIKGTNQRSKISILNVFDRLVDVAEASGTGSQERKITLLSDLIKELDPVSRRFVVRVPLGTMRLGFSEKTVLEALTLLESGEAEPSFAKGSVGRDVKEQLEEKFAVYPNIGEIIKVTRQKGIKGLSGIKLRVGVPVSPMLCGRLDRAQEMIEKMGKVAAEYKYDGTRVQIHLDREIKNQKSKIKNQLVLDGFGGDEMVKMFTRNFEQMQAVFPDLAAAVLKEVKAKEAILDTEVVGIDPQTGKFLPFQETIQRKRKYDIEEMSKKIPVKCFVFDILYKDGEDLTGRPLWERREILVRTVEGRTLDHGQRLIGFDPQLAARKVLSTEQLVTEDPKELQSYFEEARQKGLEGLVVKRWESRYEAGNRGFNWVKYKREEEGKEGEGGKEGGKSLADTIDCIVLGYYKGTGKRAGFGIGAFLTGIYDDKNGKILTIAKIGTGLTDEEWIKIKNQISKIKIKGVIKNVEIPKELMPDVLCQPKIVVAIRADEITVSPRHSSGYALRFPRMMGYRLDKSAKEATTLKEIKDLYKLQGDK